MFYSQFILAKKGPLGTIWIAAHLDRRLRKNQVADTNIGDSVDSILAPDVPIALRLSSHLLLGVVRIYSKKVNYLFDDCSEALLKVKQAFRSTAVDLPAEESKAPYHSITLPETFDLDDFELPDNDIFQSDYVDHHISSRDQITLQDNVAVAGYSTSKFGLDERFGDGDASGLDLDEELFMGKSGTSGHAEESAEHQASVQPMDSLKQDGYPGERIAVSTPMIDVVEDDDHMDYAQAPCTPGLAEEPNISNVQEASACDDHLESEGHLMDSSMRTKNENIIYEDKLDMNWCLLDEKNSDAVPQMPTDLNDVDINQSKLHAASDTAVGDSLLNEHLSVSAPSLGSSDQVNSMSQASEWPDKIRDSSDVLIEEDLQKEVLDSDKTSELPHNYQSSSEVRYDECAHSSFDQQVTNGESAKHQASPRPEVTDSGTQFLRPCNSNVEQPAVQLDASALRSPATDGSDDPEKNSQENHFQKHGPCEDTYAVSDKIEGQPDNSTSEFRTAVNINKSAGGDLPAPEKLLSVPEGDDDLHRNMLDATPRDFPGLSGDDTGSKLVSGKKRSFTESTLTEQSMNSVESSRIVRAKKTAESIPDDDDLLSSILVGRRSSILKVKPTPLLSEVTSVKRTRMAPRPGAPKRKVLMDDTMVLHGDTIRQQLTYTEDIRRVRKRAPCTRPEISMIHKRNLEDDIFLESSLTGLSMQLSTLHKQICDLSRITVCQDDVCGTSLETGGELRLASGNDENSASVELRGEPTQGKQDDASFGMADEPHLISRNDTVVNLDIENDEGEGYSGLNFIGEHGIGSRAELLVGTDNEVTKLSENELHELQGANIEADMDQDKSKPSDDVIHPDVSDEELMQDASGAINLLNNTIEANFYMNGGLPTSLPDDVKEKGSDLVVEDETGGGERGNVVSGAVQDGSMINLHGEMDYNVQDGIGYSMSGEQQIDSSYQVQNNVHVVDGLWNDGDNPDWQGSYRPDMTDLEISDFNLHDRDELNFASAGNDTDFLNVDDDEIADIADDDEPEAQETRFTENSGWSSRTRAVSKYLQTLFVNEENYGRDSLSMGNLLNGKTRKEASRMFFETLVLKTRDYIHVEQRRPFDDITIKPRMKLMKSDF